jgi:hypothetical protein
LELWYQFLIKQSLAGTIINYRNLNAYIVVKSQYRTAAHPTVGSSVLCSEQKAKMLRQNATANYL